MAKFVLIQEDDSERQYRESMEYLNSKYHDQPTKLKNLPVIDGEDGIQSANLRVPAGKHVPIGKLVL